MANIVRTDPFEEFLRGFFVRPVGLGSDDVAPDLRSSDLRVDINENAEAYIVQAELPGVKKEDISVQIDGNVLVISAERKQEKEVRDGERVLRTERRYGRVTRSFQLASELDESASSARYVDGVLQLTLPKKSAPQAKRLTIE